MTPSPSYFAATLLVILAFARLTAAAEAFAVFKSRDRGQTWVRSDAGLPDRSRINALGSANGVLFAGTDSGIFASSDEALSWQLAAGVAMSSGRVISFVSLGQKVFAGTDGNGMLVSSDGGKSWTRDAAFRPKKVRCLLGRNGWLFAGTDADGVFASQDAGETWSPLSTGFPAQGQVFALTAVEGRLFAGLYSRGLYAWNERQRLWAKIGPVTPLALASVQGALVVGHNPGGLYWSADGGASWSKGVAGAITDGPFVSALPDHSGELSAEAPVWELASDEDLVFAGASAGIYYSEDHGRTWKRARLGLPDESPGLAFLLKRDFVLAAAQIKRGAGKPDGPPAASTESTTPARAAGPPNADEAAILGIAEAWRSHYNAGDAAKVAALYAEDAYYVSAHVLAQGRAAIQGYWARGIAAGGHIDSFKPIEVRFSGDMGYCLGKYQATNAGVTVDGRVVIVLRKTDGKWCVAVHETVVRDQPE